MITSMKQFLATFIYALLLQTTLQASQDYNEIKGVGQSYLCFMSQVGQTDEPISQDDLSNLFSENCQKVENGNTLFTSVDGLPKQLAEAREVVGKWTIELLFSTASESDKTCTLQFVWKGEKMRDEHTTMVILYVNNRGKIDSIHEVWNVYQGKTLA